MGHSQSHTVQQRQQGVDTSLWQEKLLDHRRCGTFSNRGRPCFSKQRDDVGRGQDRAPGLDSGVSWFWDRVRPLARQRRIKLLYHA